MSDENILIIEDDADYAELMTERLKQSGFACTVYHDAPDFLAHMKKTAPPSVIVLDLNLPGWNGMDLLPRIKETWPTAKVIVYTGREEKHHEFLDLLKFSDRFLKKSGDLNRLAACVETMAHSR